MNLHREIHLEAEICRHLSQNGWFYAEGDAAQFDRASGLFLPDLLAWVEATQPESFERLTKTHGPALPQVLAERVRKNLNERGTLDVLRRGVEMLGLKEPLMLAQFKPALAINAATQAHYAANRLRVVRQVCHSPNHPKDALDLVLFLNGVAVATAELKSDFTQGVQDAVDQYRFDRHPQPKGGVLEPEVGVVGRVAGQDVEDEPLLDGLAHRVQVGGHGVGLPVRAHLGRAEQLQGLGLGRGGEGEDRQVLLRSS